MRGRTMRGRTMRGRTMRGRTMRRVVYSIYSGSSAENPATTTSIKRLSDREGRISNTPDNWRPTKWNKCIPGKTSASKLETTHLLSASC